MSYSCGYFQKEDTSLFEAQVGKVDHILKKLQLKPGMTLLDIGCGWGFLMKRAAVHYGVKAVGITLSQEQFEQVSREIEENHLQDRMTVKLMDYRELKDSGMMFDRAVMALQRKLNAAGCKGKDGKALKVDGLFGTNTCWALQKYLGTTADGCISNPSTCVKELQRRLNAGSF